MENRKLRANCPICGYTLCKGTPLSQVEVNCPKCGQFLQIQFVDEGVSSRMLTRKADGPGGKGPFL